VDRQQTVLLYLGDVSDEAEFLACCLNTHRHL
jgi:hypothetical protein